MSRPGGLGLPSPDGRAVLAGRLPSLSVFLPETLARPAAAVASGVLLSLAFPPVDAGWVAWVGLVPLLWAIRNRSPGAAFRLGMMTGVVWFGATLWWITLFGLPAWALLTSILALYVGAFAGLLRWLRAHYPRLPDLLLAPLVWTAIEVARSVGPLGFPWALLGVAQHRMLPILQLAALGGVPIVSAAVALGNAVLTALIAGPRRRPAVTAVGVLAVAAAVGVWRMQTPLQPHLRVAALQPAVPPLSKGDPASITAEYALMRRLTARARDAGAALIVFPETALPTNLLGDGGRAREVAAWAGDRVVVASSFEVHRESGDLGPWVARNTAVILGRGEVLGTYAKRRLVPFGEAGVTPGRAFNVVRTPLGWLGLAICYESAFSEIAREAARNGAAILVVLTNDGWFGSSGGPAQHAAFAALRAVETGRTVVRAANTGISLIVDPLGRVRGSLPLQGQGVLVGRAVRPLATPYLRAGWLLGYAVLAAVALLSWPPLLRSFRGWRRDPAFRRLALAIVIPSALVAAQMLSGRTGLVMPGVMPTGLPDTWAWMALALFTLTVFGIGGRDGGLAWRARGAPLSAALGLALVTGAGAAMASAYRAYGIAFRPWMPVGEWRILAPVLVGAIAWESWVHGAVFTYAHRWRGFPVAVLISTAIGALPAVAASPEWLLWSLFTGLGLGAIRAATGDALGLALPRAVGIILMSALPVLRV